MHLGNTNFTGLREPGDLTRLAKKICCHGEEEEEEGERSLRGHGEERAGSTHSLCSAPLATLV